MTLTTERQQFESWFTKKYPRSHWGVEKTAGGGYQGGLTAQLWEAWQESRGCMANREAQPVNGELGEIRVGRLPTMNQEEYPGLGDWWVQLRIGASGDEILARVYGATPDEAVARARALTALPAPAVPEEKPELGYNPSMSWGDQCVANAEIRGWNACRSAMLAQPVSSGYKLPPHVYRELVNCLRDTAVKYQGAQQLRAQLSRTLTENGLVASAPEGGN